MILAGDIGAAHTRLAGFETEGNKLKSVVERIYDTHQLSSLPETIREFTRTEEFP